MGIKRSQHKNKLCYTKNIERISKKIVRIVTHMNNSKPKFMFLVAIIVKKS